MTLEPERDRPADRETPAVGDATDDTVGAPDADVIIVGGGVAGLVAARELVLGGLRVVVLEASERLGGKVRSHTVDGIALDAGAESFATRRGTVAELVTRLGLEHDIETPNPEGAWLQIDNTRALPLPKAGLLGIPSVPLAADVIAIVGMKGALRAQLDALLPPSVGARERTIGGLVRRRMGRRVAELLVTPVVMGVHSRHPDSLDVDVVAPGLRAGLKKQLSLAAAVRAMRASAPAGSAVAGVRGGIARIAATLESDLARFGVDVQLDTPVTWADATGVTLSDGTRLTARAVMLAAPDRGITAREGEPPAEKARAVLVTLVVRSAALDAAPRGTGMLIAPACASVKAKALTHATSKWAWLAESAGEHRHVLRLSYDAHRVADLDTRALTTQALGDASRLLGVPLGPAELTGATRVEWVTASVDSRPAHDGVTRIGETASGTGLAAVVGQAQREARRLVAELAAPER